MKQLSGDPEGWRECVRDVITNGQGVDETVAITMRWSRGRCNPAAVAEYARSLLLVEAMNR